MAEIQRGEGPDALPFGAATALNRAQPPMEGTSSLDLGGDIPVVYAPDGQDDIPDEDEGGSSENMQVLLGRPHPNYRPAVVTDPPGKVPKKIVRQLPMLMAAARDPEAPIALKAMYRMIVRRLEREMKGG